MDLDLQYIYCGVCNKDGSSIDKDQSFLLTSCAHICCKKHLANFMDQESVCPICKTRNISVVAVDENLPPDLKTFFTPITKQIDSTISSCKFQYNALIQRVERSKRENTMLYQKIKEQKQYLMAAKDELTKMTNNVDSLKQQVKSLKSQLAKAKANPSSSYLVQSAPITPSNPSMTSNFVDKIKDSLVRNDYQSSNNYTISPIMNEKPSSSYEPFIAESTNISNFSSPLMMSLSKPSTASYSSSSIGRSISASTTTNNATLKRRSNTELYKRPILSRSSVIKVASGISSHIKVGGNANPLPNGVKIGKLNHSRFNNGFIPGVLGSPFYKKST